MLRFWPYSLVLFFFFFAAVYIPPDANSRNALQELYEVINSHIAKQPHGIFILADLRSVLPDGIPG